MNIITKLITAPLVGLIRRKFLLIVLTVASVYAAGRDDLFDLLGSWLYLFPLGFGAMLATFLVRNLAFRTMDTYADPRDGNGDFSADWLTLTPEGRVFALLLSTALIFIGFAIIAAALWK